MGVPEEIFKVAVKVVIGCTSVLIVLILFDLAKKKEVIPQGKNYSDEINRLLSLDEHELKISDKPFSNPYDNEQ